MPFNSSTPLQGPDSTAKQPSGSSAWDQGGPLTLFCGGLPQEIGGDDLQEYFGKYGTVLAAHVRPKAIAANSVGSS